jgi:hypothetical protein
MRRVFLFIVLIYLNHNLFSLDLASFIINSNKNFNSIILEILNNSDLTDTLIIAKALGKRQDPYLSDIIINILSSNNNTEITEIFLETLLFSAIIGKTDNELTYWAQVNKDALNLLMKNLSHFSNSTLKNNIIQLAFYMERADLNSYLMIEVDKLLTELKQNGGYLHPFRIEEAITLMNIIEDSGEDLFLESVLSIFEASEDPPLIRACKNTILILTE